MLPRRMPTLLRACGVFARRSLLVVPSSPLAVWVVKWDSRRVTSFTVPRCEVQALQDPPTLVKTRVLIGPLFSTGDVDNEVTFTTFSLLSLCCNNVGRFA
ncbi:C5a anaphylatoxin chemotactic receptor 1 [Bienertia sinuspersici]